MNTTHQPVLALALLAAALLSAAACTRPAAPLPSIAEPAVALTPAPTPSPVPTRPLQVPTLAPGPRLHFDAVASPQYAGRPFEVTLNATNPRTRPDVSFVGPARLLAVTGAATTATMTALHETTDTWELPLATHWLNARTQTIVLTSQWTDGPATIESIGIKIAQPPSLPVVDWEVRLGATALSRFDRPGWIEDGMTLVHRRSAIRFQPGWIDFACDPPFHVDGTSNLVVDLRFHNDAYGLTGRVYAAGGDAQRSVFAVGDNLTTGPLAWTLGGPPPHRSSMQPAVRIGWRPMRTVPVRPAATGHFDQGRWQGRVVFQEPIGRVALLAVSTGGVGELSAPFRVQSAPPPEPSAASRPASPTGLVRPANLMRAVDRATSGATLNLAPGSTSETLRIDRPIRLRAPDGPVRIGDGGGQAAR